MSKAERAIGVVGAGKVGLVLSTALMRAGHTVVSVWDPSSDAIGRAKPRLGPFIVAETVADVATSADLILLAVPDDALPGMAKTLAAHQRDWTATHVVHVSGRYGRAVLEPLSELGAKTIALHPAMAFNGDIDTELTRIVGARFAVTATSDDRSTAEGLVRDMGAVPFEVAEEDRILYHAALAHATNHLVTLIVQSTAMLKRISVSDASEVLRPAVTAALENALHRGPAGATGPVVRGDAGTVDAHVRELGERMPDTLPVYRAVSEAAAEIARAAGTLSGDQHLRIVAALNPEPTGPAHRALFMT